jgi:hypothetical protein
LRTQESLTVLSYTVLLLLGAADSIFVDIQVERGRAQLDFWRDSEDGIIVRIKIVV